MARLVALGDSLTQGFRSLAITDTTLSAPSLIAEAMGLRPHDFRSPDFRGQGGLPLNVERVVRELETRCGGSIGFLEWAQASLFLAELVDDVEDFWERGDGSKPVEDEALPQSCRLGLRGGGCLQPHGGAGEAGNGCSKGQLAPWPISFARAQRLSGAQPLGQPGPRA